MERNLWSKWKSGIFGSSARETHYKWSSAQCFTVKAGIDGFLDIARRSFCDTSEAIHNLANKYRKEFKLPNLKIPFNNRHGFYFNIPQQVHSGSKGDLYRVLNAGHGRENLYCAYHVFIMMYATALISALPVVAIACILPDSKRL
ncbi:DNA mismatch repair protein MSH4 [Tanacetum coccineum]